MTSKQIQLDRIARETQRMKDEFAGEIKRGLLLLRYLGRCKCGLMLTERDRKQGKKTYRCPHCGASGPLLDVA
jgi:predicted SprT family Zn-dependent metalloprotease